MLRSFSLVLMGNLARQISFLLVNAILFERLSRSMFGALALAFSYMTIFAGLGEFGIRQIAWRDIARWPLRARILAAKFFTTKVLTAGLSLCLYLLMLPVLWRVEAPTEIYVLYGFGILVSGGTFDFPLFALDRIDLFAKFSSIAFGFYLLTCAALVTTDGEAWLVPSLLVASMGLLFVLEFLWFRSKYGPIRLSLRAAEAGQILRDSWSLGLGETLTRLALGYPLILIGLVLGSESVGNYRIAEMGYSFLAQVGHMFATASFSQLSHRFEHSRSTLPRAIGRLAIPTGAIAIVGGVSFTVAGPPSFELIFGGITPATVSVLQILGIALIFAGPARFLKALLPSIDKQHLVLPVNAVGMGTGIAVGWFAISQQGIIGMAFAVALAEFTSLLALALVYWNALRATTD